MRTTNIAKKLKQMGEKHRISLESTTVNVPAEPVEQLPTDLPYGKEQDHSDETGVTMDVVEPVELYEELEEAIADVALDIATIENLTIVSNLSQKNLNNGAMEEFVKTTVGLESAGRLLSSTTTGGIQCSADIISLEEIAGNAAKAGWENVYRKVMGILSKAEKISETTEETAKRIQDDFRAIKKAVFAYRGGSSVNIAVMSNGDANLNAVIANTRQAILEDLSGKTSAGLDKAINDIASKTAAVLTSKKGTISDIVAKATKDADSLDATYKIKEPEFVILGFTRRNLDDKLHLPKGTIGLLTGGVYNYPRYSPNKQTKAIEVELKPNTAKELYAIGMNIGNEIAEQARIWPQRVESLKAIAEMAKSQSRDVDEDRNTWSAEQTGSSNTVKMWNTNASARKHYINVFNKIAGEILEVLKHVAGASTEPSTELFGFGKPKALNRDQAGAYVQSNLSKFKEGTVEANLSLLGGQSNPEAVGKHIDTVITTLTQLVTLAKEPFDKVYIAIGKFEDDDNEDELDDTINKSMAPLIKRLSKPLVINSYEARAVQYKNGGYGLEGTFDKPESSVQSLGLTNAQLTALLSKAEGLLGLRELTRKLHWLDYAQEYCDWVYPLIQMLEYTYAQVLDIALKAVGSKDHVSTEVFGGFFSKKPKEADVPPVPVHKPDLKDLIKSTAFPGFKDNYTADIVCYNEDFKQHVASMHKAAQEIGKAFNESNINKYIDDVKKLLDRCYVEYREGEPNETDWREVGNRTLELFVPELSKSKLLSKHFGMHYSNGSYSTRFDYAPNLLIVNTDAQDLGNKRLVKRLVSGFTKDTALQFFSVMDSIDEIPLQSAAALDGCLFLRENPRFDDAVYIHAVEPMRAVTTRLFDIMDESYFAIRDGLIQE